MKLKLQYKFDIIPSLIFLVMARNNSLSDTTNSGNMILPCHTLYTFRAQIQVIPNFCIHQTLHG